ncbi:pentatricopeptide repeat-containing protein At2g17033 [Jatropha curcas]|uniref:pentatricopeptide repeat-containing protein At2g17033 n=1 Tax=Jatropha curcas TaxID=180498 RepID=UPI0005FB2601|nr:pentatricopeptide repeat-containing protein At2g17033 [Jatropha curcas]
MYPSIRYQVTLVTFQVPRNKHRRHCQNYHHHHIQVGPLETKLSSKWRVFECAALSKQGQRFLSSLATATAARDNSATNSLIKKFVAASPKSIALDALSHLLSPNSSYSHLSSLAFPLYLKIQEAHWFDWNPKLVAEVVALLDKQGQYNESGTLISDSISKLKLRERDLALFYCNLVESHSKQNCVQGFEDSFARLNQLVFSSNSVYIKKQAYKSMISGLCEMGRPKEAQDLIEEMRGKGVKPSVYEFRCVLHAYGKLGLFQEMQMILDQMESGGFKVDTVCSNMVLSSYGVYNALPEIVSWLKKMKDLGIPFSSRTCNSVLNSCPTMMSTVQNSNANTYPISIQELMKILRGDEAMVVNELIIGSSSVLEEAMQWDALESKLDLHGMHLCSAYLIMLLWFEEMKNRFNGGNYVIPAEITVVCGSGNHSIVRGESPVKRMIKSIMVQTRSPMRVDRKNLGCFIAKGKVVKEWLS